MAYLQYSPKIMHAQEVVQEVLAMQEYASGQKKLNWGLSARSSNCKFKVLSASSCKKLQYCVGSYACWCLILAYIHI